MKIIHEYSGTETLVLEPGQQEHWVLINPHQATLHITQHEGSSMTLHCISLDGADADIDITAVQADAHCETHLYGIGLLYGQQKHSLTTHVLHQHKASTGPAGAYSNQLVKNILLDEATGAFYGELKVMTDAQKTEAHQTNRNILLSRTARMNTKPQLEIYADDVKCSHGATTGQLDQQALFYMQQRGISRQTAQRLLLSAFLSEVLDTINDDTLRDQLSSEIDTILA